MKYLAVVERELQDNLRSFKLPFLLMFIFGGILMALYTEVGPTANSSDVIDPFFELFAMLCPMIGIFAAMDAIIGAKENGPLELVLSKPLPRYTLLLGKFTAYVFMIVPLLVAELIGAYFWAGWTGISENRWHLPMPDFSQWMMLVLLVTLVALFFVALTMLISMFARSTAVTGLAAIVFMAPAHPLGGEFLRQVGLALGIETFAAVPLPAKFVISVFSRYQKYCLGQLPDYLICASSLVIMIIGLLTLGAVIFERQNITFSAQRPLVIVQRARQALKWQSREVE